MSPPEGGGRGGYRIAGSESEVSLTVFAPRDGADRTTSAADLTLYFTPAQFHAFTSECIYVNAGTKR